VELYQLSYARIIKWVGMVSNHRRRQPMDLQSIPFSHSGTYPAKPQSIYNFKKTSGADGGNQTPDHSITSRMLYQLSYIGLKNAQKSFENIIYVES
jgi:hypothetical protein